MWKLLLLGFSAGLEMYEIAGQSGGGQTDTNPAPISSCKEVHLQTDATGHYSFNAGNIIFNLNAHSLRKNMIPNWINSAIDTDVEPASDYLVSKGIGAHKVHLRKLPWNRARKICTEEGGHLAVIRTESEEKIVVGMMKAAGTDGSWLGVHDQFEEGDWVTVTDEPLAQTGWAKWSKTFAVNPDNFHGKQHCARMTTDKPGMDDESCDKLNSFVCKISSV